MKREIARMVDIPAHVARQYLGKLGKIDNGVVFGTRLWADEGVYYPLEIEPYTPESYFAKGKDDPDFRDLRSKSPYNSSNKRCRRLAFPRDGG